MLGKVSETNLFSTVSSYRDTEYGMWNVTVTEIQNVACGMLQLQRYRIWHVECGATDETNGVAWLLTELEKLRGIIKKPEKGTRRRS